MGKGGRTTHQPPGYLTCARWDEATESRTLEQRMWGRGAYSCQRLCTRENERCKDPCQDRVRTAQIGHIGWHRSGEKDFQRSSPGTRVPEDAVCGRGGMAKHGEKNRHFSSMAASRTKCHAWIRLTLRLNLPISFRFVLGFYWIFWSGVRRSGLGQVRGLEGACQSAWRGFWKMRLVQSITQYASNTEQETATAQHWAEKRMLKRGSKTNQAKVA